MLLTGDSRVTDPIFTVNDVFLSKIVTISELYLKGCEKHVMDLNPVISFWVSVCSGGFIAGLSGLPKPDKGLHPFFISGLLFRRDPRPSWGIFKRPHNVLFGGFFRSEKELLVPLMGYAEVRGWASAPNQGGYLLRGRAGNGAFLKRNDEHSVLQTDGEGLNVHR